MIRESFETENVELLTNLQMSRVSSNENKDLVCSTHILDALGRS